MLRNRPIYILFATLTMIAVGLAGACVNNANTGTGNGSNGASQLENNIGKPQPIANYFHGCPPSGDGGDPLLNTLKNRVDEGNWQPTTVAAILALTWPKSIEQQSRSRWSDSDAAAIAAHEGTPVQMEGYLAAAKKQSPETCNCHAVDQVDYHVWIVDDPNKGRDQSVVIEAAPRVRASHPAWTLERLQALASRREKVRISGWLMMDPEHPDQIGKTRGTIWEVHPIMQIETLSGGTWTPLDNGSTGVRSGGAAAQTAPPVTTVPPATQPPASNRSVQNNGAVQITDLFYNGAGSQEPDEYVELTNTGAQPVDITDWTLQDNTGRDRYKWENYVMQPGAKIRVYTNETHPESGGFNIGSGQAIWGNRGDVAQLFDADKILVARYAYGDQK